MTVHELIEKLQKLDQNKTIYIYDDDEEVYSTKFDVFKADTRFLEDDGYTIDCVDSTWNFCTKIFK